jgi:hypothetical protein
VATRGCPRGLRTPMLFGSLHKTGKRIAGMVSALLAPGVTAMGPS